MKVVIIVDNPVACEACFASDKNMCRIIKRSFFDVTEPKPLWCPMRKLPTYKMDWTNTHSYEAGWNDVLDLIGGRDIENNN